MLLALKGVSEGQNLGLYHGCRNRSDYGGREGSIRALRNAGYIEGSAITEAGLEALANVDK